MCISVLVFPRGSLFVSVLGCFCVRLFVYVCLCVSLLSSMCLLLSGGIGRYVRESVPCVCVGMIVFSL